MVQSALQDLPENRIFYRTDDFIENDSGIFHGFFGRHGGVSKDIYESLNCGRGSHDDAYHVLQNRRIVSEISNIEEPNLLSVHQVHGNRCVIVDEVWAPADKPKADGLVTDKSGIGLGILTADCAPVLFYGKKRDGAPVIGAAHAGWRGAIGGILESTVDMMKEKGVDLNTIKACVGPCIAKVSYEVSNEFYRTFIEHSNAYERFFQNAKKTGYFMFDLAGFCAFRLYEAGVSSVVLMDLDTYADENLFFSYRRTIHRAEKDYGRQISLISIRDYDW